MLILLFNFSGVHSHRQRILSKSESNQVVDVYTIVTKLPFLGMSVASNTHFLTWHEKFELLDYLLSSNITLYYMDSDEMVFLEHEQGVNIYDTKEYPFFFMAQRYTAFRMLTVPLCFMPDLASKLTKPQCKVTWICHMARCGSTTVVQGINAIPNCVAISESQDILKHLTSVYAARKIEIRDYVKTQEFKDVLKFSVSYMLRSFSKYQHVCPKTTASFAYHLISPLSELFPSHKFISMHRDGLGTAKSFWRMGSGHSLLKFGVWTMKNFPSISKQAYEKVIVVFANGLQSEVMDIYTNSEITMFLFFYMQWITNMVTFQRNKSSVKELMALCHDDFQQDKKGSMMKVSGLSFLCVFACSCSLILAQTSYCLICMILLTDKLCRSSDIFLSINNLYTMSFWITLLLLKILVYIPPTFQSGLV